MVPNSCGRRGRSSKTVPGSNHTFYITCQKSVNTIAVSSLWHFFSMATSPSSKTNVIICIVQSNISIYDFSQSIFVQTFLVHIVTVQCSTVV